MENCTHTGPGDVLSQTFERWAADQDGLLFQTLADPQDLEGLAVTQPAISFMSGTKVQSFSQPVDSGQNIHIRQLMLTWTLLVTDQTISVHILKAILSQHLNSRIIIRLIAMKFRHSKHYRGRSIGINDPNARRSSAS